MTKSSSNRPRKNRGAPNRGQPGQRNNSAPRRGRRPQQRRGRGPKSSDPTKQLAHLTELVANARKKYFELYFRAATQQKAKLEKVYYDAIARLRDYENSMDEKAIERVSKGKGPQKPDLAYSTNHDISPEEYSDGLNLPEDKNGPHVLQSQIQSDYSEDTEESSGNMDDYQSYKGDTSNVKVQNHFTKTGQN